MAASMRLKKSISLAIYFCLVQAVAAQDLRSALERMQQTVKESTQMHVVMTIDVYEDIRSEKSFYHDVAEVNRNDNSYLYHFGVLDFLMNDKYVIIVDRQERRIMLQDRDLTSETEFRKSISFNLDSLLLAYKNPKFIGNINGIEHYQVLQNQNSISQIDLFINNRTNLLDKMQYGYKEGQFVSIHFDQFEIHPKFKEDEFDELLYFSKLNGKYQLAEKFKDFKISDSKNQ
jgi:hypothetical protein